MKRFLLAHPPDERGAAVVEGDGFHYLVRVRRVRVGEVFKARLPDGRAVRALAQVIESARMIVELHPDSEEALDGVQAETRLVLFVSLLKGDKLDLVMRQAAEGAVDEIVPFESEYSQVKCASFNAARLERWERIVREARQQSGSFVPTRVHPPCSFESALSYWEELKQREPGQGDASAVGILLHQTPLTPPLGKDASGTDSPSLSCEDTAGILNNRPPDPLAARSFHAYLRARPSLAALAVGSEGGFAPSEAERFMACGWKPLVLGHSILRSETAALYGMAAMRIILLESSSWT